MKTIRLKKQLCQLVAINLILVPSFQSLAIETCLPRESDRPNTITVEQGSEKSLTGYVNWGSENEFTTSVQWVGTATSYLSSKYSEDVSFRAFSPGIYELSKTVTSNLGNISEIPYTLEVKYIPLQEVVRYENTPPTVLVTDFGIYPDDGIDDSDAFLNLLNNLNDGDVVEFPKGEFVFEKPVRIFNNFARNITIQGNEGTIIQKSIEVGTNPDSRGSLWYIDKSVGLTIQNLKFKGIYNTVEEQYKWANDGVYMASATDLIIRQNHFFGFGDSCLRLNTSKYHDSPGIYADNILVSNNTFEQCLQVSTTIKHSNFGGVNNLEFSDNSFINMRGPLKLATRQPAQGIKVLRNKFMNGIGDAMNVIGYSNVDISNNLIENYPNGYFINITPSAIRETLEIKDININENVVLNNGFGIRIQPLDTHDEVIPMKNTVIENNYFENTPSSSDSKFKSINIANYFLDVFSGIKVKNNSYWNQIDNSHDKFIDTYRLDKAAVNWVESDNTNIQLEPNSLRVPQ
ncbi:hypothetical protein [Motilimonas cestriensis]|uniref:hypothetical protein n=1 Tax=Motilimonas cestriensis TaxID=2742685 RepID=UPI003DA40CB0